MASARIVHLVGHKRRIPHRSCPSEDFVICSNFASRFGEYLMTGNFVSCFKGIFHDLTCFHAVRTG